MCHHELTVTTTDDESTIQWPFRRSVDDRLISGVAGGVAEQLGFRAVYVRAALLSLMLAGGAGVLLYILAALVVPETDSSARNSTTTAVQRVGAGLLFLAAMFLFQGIGLWFGQVVWPTTLVFFGLAIAIDTSGFNYEQSLKGVLGTTRRPWWIVLAGLAVMMSGLVLVLNSLDAFQSAGALVGAVALTLVGFLIVGGPWLWSLVSDLGTERRARIRADERAEIAAHLHDSVLQSLALIQRSDDPKRMVTLARAQERDLRSWLYDSAATGEETLRGALTAAATRVEEAHDVPVSLVVVGEDSLSATRRRALVGATTEAMMNAAQHSGVDKISVFATSSGAEIEVFVTDQGIGFDPGSVDVSRRGISESIKARMTRNGGTALIDTQIGEGTEVHLTMSRGEQ